ncbi:MAG: type III ribulose-bisphosphate carboxylase [Candidatus Micrarchaeales archaeon]
MKKEKSIYSEFVNFGYKPSRSDLICLFKFSTKKDVKESVGAIAAESSTGTWTRLTTETNELKRKRAKVFEIKKNRAKIAYPLELFELGNAPQLLSSIAGNIFGMKEVETLRLEDVSFPEEYIKSFKGPKYGIQGIRKIFDVWDRPLLGAIIKPKLGLSTSEHVKVAKEEWIGGVDIIKDDENLTSQSFNDFSKRVKEITKAKKEVEKITGEKKAYLFNVTSETKEMLKRAKLVSDYGNEYIMVDILTVGFSALQTLREECEKLGLAIHAHRAMHAALTRNKKHGISMLFIAKLSRLIGVDQIHVGAVIGKMESSYKEVMQIVKELKNEEINEKELLYQKWYGIKSVFPVASGGLHPGVVDKLYEMFGKDVIIQAGGGIAGHKQGPRKGAIAMRQALDACLKGISLKDYAKNHDELKVALKQFGLEKNGEE